MSQTQIQIVEPDVVIEIATAQPIGFVAEWLTLPASQPAKIADPSGGLTQDTEARAAIAAVIDVLEQYGFTAAT
jgi:hypothetical protein